MVVNHGQPKITNAVLAAVVGTGQLVGVASTEPSGGTDLAGLDCVVSERDGGWALNGAKGLLSRIDESMGFVVFAKAAQPCCDEASDNLRQQPLSAFWVPADSPGLGRESAEPMGMRGWSWGYLHFDDVRLDSTYLLGSPSGGRAIFDQHFTKWRLLMGLVCLGSALSAVRHAQDRLRTRQIGRRRLSDIPVAAHRLGEAVVRVESAISWCLALLDGIDRGDIDMVGSCGAKALATDVAFDAVDATIQLFGAEGYSTKWPFERFLRDIRGLRIADGSNDALYSIVGRSALKEHSYLDVE